MASSASTPWQPARPERLSRRFSRLGWLGIWIQVTTPALPLLLPVYVLFPRSPGAAQRIGIDLSNHLSCCRLLVVVVTTFWFFRYTPAGKRLADPEPRPTWASVERTLWVDPWASGLGNAFYMVLRLVLVGGCAIPFFTGKVGPGHVHRARFHHFFLHGRLPELPART